MAISNNSLVKSQEYLLNTPDSQLDEAMKPLIRKWSSPPLALQILEVLDKCIYGALASGFVVSLLQYLYDDACKAQRVSHEDNVRFAIWREMQE